VYLLCLFRWVLVKVLIPYVPGIPDVQEGAVLGWSWGVVVLAAMYRGMCQGYTKTANDTILIGCPLLLQLWLYERFATARPIIDLGPYEQALYHDD
jgi:hypothetical protein